MVHDAIVPYENPSMGIRICLKQDKLADNGTEP